MIGIEGDIDVYDRLLLKIMDRCYDILAIKIRLCSVRLKQDAHQN